MDKIAKIKGVFRQLGITPNLKGYHYLENAVIMTKDDIDKGDIPRGITTIYHELGRQFHVTHCSVERCMRNCICIAKSNNPEFFDTLFGKLKKVTVSNFVSVIADYIEQKEDL